MDDVTPSGCILAISLIALSAYSVFWFIRLMIELVMRYI